MIPTVFGAVLIIAGIWLLLRGSVVAMFALVVFASLFGGSAAFILPALGGSSIPPVNIALLFLLARVVVPGSGQGPLVRAAFADNLSLAVFVGYGVVMALVGPRLFADLLRVAPMRQANGPLFASLPLVPTSQNLTTAFYMTGTLLCAIGSYVACRDPRGLRALVDTGVITGWAHFVFGVISAFGGNGVAKAFLGFFRNAGYAQLNEEVEGAVRIAGIQPEPSSFAIVSLVWFVFMFECWALKVRPRATGPLALALLIILIATTSTSGYVGLAGYGAVRLIISLGRGGGRRALSVAALALAVIAGVAALTYFYPQALASANRVYTAVITKKGTSDSGLQRAYWAHQGLTLFAASDGLGIGPGSFRSSSLITAIIGATGVVGTLAFAVYLGRLLFRRASPVATTAAADERVRIGIAATWAALSFVIVASVVSASPDPTAFFAIFAAAALAARRPAARPDTVSAKDAGPVLIFAGSPE